MNDLGWALAWLSLQVTCLLAPALGLQRLASRRGPRSGAWVATWSLGLVVALGMSAFFPPIQWDRGPIRPVAGSVALPTPIDPTVKPVAPGALGDSRGIANLGRPSSGWRAVWNRFGRRAAGPVSRVRPWGWVVAVVVPAGMGFGLIRLVLGLGAVGLYRRRGRPVADGPIPGLVEQLRGAMGCRPTVEVREVVDLATPATAGWRRPMILLPIDWRSWDEAERRAVVAHELAHVVRGDYAAGLMARVAVVLNYHHPMVRWMAGRLHLEQELAADALAARFSGGRAAYLVALSSLALKQDGRSPRWPARAFLPARGTLIRRIAMLRNESRANELAPTSIWSRPKRLLTAFGLLALTTALATWKAPARGEDDIPPSTRPTELKVEGPDVQTFLPPLEPIYVPDSMAGIVAFRPAAAFRHPGLNRLLPLIHGFLAEDLEMIAKTLQVDSSQPGFLKFGFEEVESVIFGCNVGQPQSAPNDPKGANPKLHSLEISGFTVRMVAPFDWLAFFRQWKVGVEEVREGRNVYYSLKFPDQAAIDFPLFVYLPDDRTLVADEQKWIRELVRREGHSAPAWTKAADWRKASRGLLAVAINNQGDRFTKGYDLGRPDDAMVVECLKGVDRWVLGVADADAPTLRAEATTRDPQAAEAVARTIAGLVKLGQAAADSAGSARREHPANYLLAKKFLANLKVAPEGRSVTLSAEGYGTYAELSGMIKIENAPEAGDGAASPKAQAAEAKAKAEER